MKPSTKRTCRADKPARRSSAAANTAPGAGAARKDVPEAEQQQIRSHGPPQRDLTRRQPTQMQRQQQIANEQGKESGEHPSGTHLIQRGTQLPNPARGAHDDQQRADAHPRPKQESDDPLQLSRSYKMRHHERQRRSDDRRPVSGPREARDQDRWDPEAASLHLGVGRTRLINGRRRARPYGVGRPLQG